MEMEQLEREEQNSLYNFWCMSNGKGHLVRPCASKAQGKCKDGKDEPAIPQPLDKEAALGKAIQESVSKFSKGEETDSESAMSDDMKEAAKEIAKETNDMQKAGKETNTESAKADDMFTRLVAIAMAETPSSKCGGSWQ